MELLYLKQATLKELDLSSDGLTDTLSTAFFNNLGKDFNIT